MARDYYDILGLSKSASESEIKSSYRKLAMKYHPDRNPGDKKAEDKFKEISESYEILKDPQKKVLIMGNHGVMVTGNSVADTFNRLYYFERAAKTYIKALQTGQPLRVIPDDVAEKTASEIENYSYQGDKHLEELKKILDYEGSDYAS